MNDMQKVDVLAASRKPYVGAQIHLMGSSRHKPACGQRNPRAVTTMESFLAIKPQDRCEKCAALARVGGGA